MSAHATRTRPSSERFTCTRCGIERQTHPGRPNRTGLCRDCLHLPNLPPSTPLTGTWTLRGGIRVWQPPTDPAVETIRTAIHHITTTIHTQLTQLTEPPATAICPTDGCLLLGDEPCPACQTRAQTTEEAA